MTGTDVDILLDRLTTISSAIDENTRRVGSQLAEIAYSLQEIARVLKRREDRQ